MPSRKVLKSVGHNFAHSITSTMNWIDDDYFVGHILKVAIRNNCDEMKIDILKNSINPTVFDIYPINKSIKYYTDWFPKLVKNSGADLSFVREAKLSFKFDLEKSPNLPKNLKKLDYKYEYNIIIIDDHGRNHTSNGSDIWNLNSNLDNRSWFGKLITKLRNRLK